jgi:[ribosomal protein S5]-alanine N-acetyltransferase
VPAVARPDVTVLETERLYLRELQPSDADDLFEILGDPQTMAFYPSPKTREETDAWIAWSRGSYAERGFGLWASVLKSDGALVGDCGLTVQSVDGEGFVEVGYHLNKRLWHRGYATEAAVACRDHAFETVGVGRLIALIRPENEPSWRVARRLGMSVWRRTERAGLAHDVYAMTRQEWEATGSQREPRG